MLADRSIPRSGMRARREGPADFITFGADAVVVALGLFAGNPGMLRLGAV